MDANIIKTRRLLSEEAQKVKEAFAKKTNVIKGNCFEEKHFQPKVAHK